MNKIASFAIRYGILLLLGIFFEISYLIFTPLTVKPSFYFLSQIYDARVVDNVIFIKDYYAKIVPACVAGAAYYLLLILNLATPMNLKKRLGNLVYIIGLFLILNIIRITVFVSLWTSGFEYFDLTHELTWYFGSTVLVVLIWFSSIFLFKIKDFPAYSDIKYLVKSIYS